MEEINKFLNSNQWNQVIENYSKLSPQMPEIFKAQDRIAKNFSGISMALEIAKRMKQYSVKFDNPALSGIEAMSKAITLKTENLIPQTTIDAIALINQQHEKLFSKLEAMTDSLRVKPEVLAQINNLSSALSNISGQVAAIAAQRRDWTILDDFEEINAEMIEFSESLTEEVTEEQENQLLNLLSKTRNFTAKYKVKVSNILSIIMFLTHIHMYSDFIKVKPELATQQSVDEIAVKQDSGIHILKIIKEQTKQNKEYRITNRDCEVKLKPKSKTIVLSKLPKGFDLIVIQIHHKWVYVSFFDPKDNLPQSGWIMKKYLNKPD